MECGGIGQRSLQDYREISTASAAVHNPGPGLWQTVDGGVLGVLYPRRWFCNNPADEMIQIAAA
jgi:hypothetical protein